jgi:hypothetical protein
MHKSFHLASLCSWRYEGFFDISRSMSQKAPLWGSSEILHQDATAGKPDSRGVFLEHYRSKGNLAIFFNLNAEKGLVDFGKRSNFK